jgi:hypothetical protein
MDIKTKSNESLEQLTREPIDVTEFLKNITETKIISIEDNIKEYLKTSNKQLTTLSEIKDYHNWAKPSGIKPDEAYTFDDIQKMVEDNPDKKFSKSDVWVNTSLIYIITKFNRVPQIPECLRHLDFTNGLNWEALDTPHYYLVKHNGRLVLCSTIGGHRGTMCVLSNGYNKNMPCRVTYIGSVDIGDVAERCALIHHIDCNKRANQNATDRLSSGVEAKDQIFINTMEDLIYCNMYADEDQMKSDSIDGFRKCSSWQGFKSIRGDRDPKKNTGYGLSVTKYAVDIIMKNTPDEETILTQALETIACFKYHFGDRCNQLCSSKDIFKEYLELYFGINTQSDLKSEGKLHEDVLNLVKSFNKWCKKKNLSKQSAITNKHLINAFGDKLEIK